MPVRLKGIQPGGGGTNAAHEAPYVALLIRVSNGIQTGLGEPTGAAYVAAPLDVE